MMTDKKREALTAAGVFGLIGDAAEYAYDYLEQFGWLSAPGVKSLSDAVESFQTFTHGSLAVDGILGPKTLAVMRLPRCGVSDHARQGGQLNKWAHDFRGGESLTYQFQNFLPNISRADQTDCAQLWYDLWSQYGGVKARPARSGEHVNVLIAFSSRRVDEFGRPGGVLAWHELPQGVYSKRGQLLFRFDASEPWYVRKDQLGQNLLGTGCHEAGHGWGIDHGGDGLMQPFAVNGIDEPRPGYDREQIALRYGGPLDGAKPTDDTIEVLARTMSGVRYEGVLERRA